MNQFWNDRYRTEEFVYGTSPNLFFKNEIDKLKAGKILLPAEGEGRNAIYAAKLGWYVKAFDTSTTGRQKAMRLAKKENVEIEYQLKGYENIDFYGNQFDVIALIYAHMPLALRSKIHKKLLLYLKPNGKIILEGFSKEQLNYNSGGPGNKDMLFSKEELLSDFSELSQITINKEIVDLSEGNFHKGKASVIRLVGAKQ